jgi:hypothetical protein
MDENSAEELRRQNRMLASLVVTSVVLVGSVSFVVGLILRPRSDEGSAAGANSPDRSVKDHRTRDRKPEVPNVVLQQPVTLAELQAGKWTVKGLELVAPIYMRFDGNGFVYFPGALGGEDVMGTYTYRGNELTILWDGVPVVWGRLTWHQRPNSILLSSAAGIEEWRRVP